MLLVMNRLLWGDEMTNIGLLCRCRNATAWYNHSISLCVKRLFIHEPWDYWLGGVADDWFGEWPMRRPVACRDNVWRKWMRHAWNNGREDGGKGQESKLDIPIREERCCATTHLHTVPSGKKKGDSGQFFSLVYLNSSNLILNDAHSNCTPKDILAHLIYQHNHWRSRSAWSPLCTPHLCNEIGLVLKHSLTR